MPTALTTNSGREDLLEAAVSFAADVLLEPAGNRNNTLARIAALTARYLNTLRLEPETGEEEHDELHRAAVALLDVAVSLGCMAVHRPAQADGRLRGTVAALPELAYAYLGAMNTLHNPGRALLPAPISVRPREHLDAILRENRPA